MSPNQILNGRYKIIKSLGEGGMANVYLARDLILNRDVAVKIVRFDMRDDVRSIKRFQQEALSTTELVHPNIVGVYDIGEFQGINYLVMEYVEGTDLKQYIKKHFPIPLPTVIDIMEQILSGVKVAHEHGIIHRDLKPQNILINAKNQIKITDFGIAIANEQSSFTKTNTLIGSVQYLSPEQVRGHIATRQSDIYSLGIILFELLTGKVPFEGESPVSIAVKHYQNDLPRVKEYNPKIPQSLENVVLKATAKNPIDRYKNVSQMADDLRTALKANRKDEKVYVGKSAEEKTIVLDQKEIDKAINQSKNNSDKIKTNRLTDAQNQLRRYNHQHPLRKRIGLLLLYFLIFMIGIFLAFKICSPNAVAVPDMANQTVSQANTKLAKDNLGVGQILRQSDDNVGYNKIIKTLPKKNQTIQKGLKVNIVVSDGPENFKVDNYVGSDFNSTKKQLTDKGFKVKRKGITTSRFDQNRIIEQDLTPGRVVTPKNTTITFSVAN